MNEFALIDAFVRCFDVEPSPFGPGDDCAVIGPRKASVVTTDAVFEHVHFTRPAFSFADIGHKALAVNLSDLAAMGARPDWFTVALGLPPRVSDRQVVQLGEGMAALARIHGARLVGGNVSRASELSVTITLAGTIPGKPLLRSGAKPGDGVYLSGTVGGAAGGLLEPSGGLLASQKRPTPHVHFAQQLRGFASACIDVSDGLVQDLGHLCAASKVGAELESEHVPLHPELIGFDPEFSLDLGLTGGEDYVLLFTARPRHRRALLELGAFEIGTISEREGVRLDGKPISRSGGFQHR